MSTTYRAVIHCDRRDSGKCHGLLEMSSATSHGTPATLIHRASRDKGWLRGYRASGTYDVCPGCQTSEERAMIRSTEPETQETAS